MSKAARQAKTTRSEPRGPKQKRVGRRVYPRELRVLPRARCRQHRGLRNCDAIAKSEAESRDVDTV